MQQLRGRRCGNSAISSQPMDSIAASQPLVHMASQSPIMTVGEDFLSNLNTGVEGSNSCLHRGFLTCSHTSTSMCEKLHYSHSAWEQWWCMMCHSDHELDLHMQDIGGSFLKDEGSLMRIPCVRKCAPWDADDYEARKVQWQSKLVFLVLKNGHVEMVSGRLLHTENLWLNWASAKWP